MVKRTGPTNYFVRKLITTFNKLKKEKPLFGKIAEELSRPRRKKQGVNLWKIEKYAKEGEIVVIPYKLLAKGDLKKKVIIFALDYSKRAKKILEEKNIEFYTLDKLPEYLKDKKGLSIRIIK